MASKDENERPAKRLRPNDGSEFSEMTSHFPSIDIQSKQIHILSTAIAAGNKIISDLSSLIMYVQSYDPSAGKKTLEVAKSHIFEFIEGLITQKQKLELNRHGQIVTSMTSYSSLGNPRNLISSLSSPLANHNYPYTPFIPSNSISPLPLGIFSPIRHPAPSEKEAPIDFKNCTLNNFSMLEILGSGSYGCVRLCQHKETKTFFCLKILNKARVVKLKQSEHINNEKSVLLSVNHHFIVKLFRSFKDQENLYLLMQFVPGGELFNYIRKAGKLSEEVTKFYSAEIIVALDYLHKKNIIYRDLKPENLLLDEMGHIKITDFGFSKVITERTNSLCGTPEYMAPEIITNKGHGKSVDWWSLGILIFEMLAGYPPFSEDSNSSVFEKILNNSLEIPDFFNSEIVDLLNKLLNKEPSHRLGYNGAEEVKTHFWFQSIKWDELNSPNFITNCNGPLNPELGATRKHNFYTFSESEVTKITEPQDSRINYDEIFASF